VTSFVSLGLHIQPTTIAALEDASNIWAILAEYAEEAAVKGLPPPAIRAETYKDLEAKGILHPISALLHGELIGYVTVMASEIPHYSRVIAITESFFVMKAHRNTGAGLKLLRAAEKTARELGSPGLLVSAPMGGRLFEVLTRAGYSETNRVFFKGWADA
jgi:GNAT superfamily N-acetyltransferase